jgi:membrane-bound serine protease (ClpP class)
VVGVLCLLLAFFAFSVLPVNYAGVLLILFGLILLILEVVVTSFGLLTVGGLVALAFGSMILVDSPLPELQLNLRLVLPMVLALAAIAVMLARLAYAAQRRVAVTGNDGMAGEVGQALTAIEPGQGGQVATHGEIWQASASEAVPKGSRVRVIRVDGLRLIVKSD